MRKNKMERKTKRKERKKTCNECGLSNANSETRPANPYKTPCQFCNRNANAQAHIADFHSETWALDSHNNAIIEQPDPHECNLLRILHEIINIYETKPEEVEA